MTSKEIEIRLTIHLSAQESWDLAQFFMRVGFADYRSNAIDDAEAYRMSDAGEKIRKAFAACG